MLLAWLVLMATSPPNLAHRRAKDGTSMQTVTHYRDLDSFRPIGHRYIHPMTFPVPAFPSVAGKYATDDTNEYGVSSGATKCSDQRTKAEFHAYNGCLHSFTLV